MYNVVDNEWSMANYGDQAVVWQTAIKPVIAMELLHKGTWKPGKCRSTSEVFTLNAWIIKIFRFFR
jgi:hypothetical protein